MGDLLLCAFVFGTHNINMEVFFVSPSTSYRKKKCFSFGQRQAQVETCSQLSRTVRLANGLRTRRSARRKRRQTRFTVNMFATVEFGVIHRRENMTEAGFARRLRSVAEELQHQATYRVPQAKESKNLAERFRKHGEQYLQFITTPEIDPTNNLAEQAIRFVVIDRKITP